MYQNLLRKREELKRLEAQGKHKYEYDSDEETEGGTWEHKLRSAEMEATQMWAEELTAQAEGKHHIGDFLPPDELKKFMEQYNAVKQGKEPDLSDYKEYKLKEDNIGTCWGAFPYTPNIYLFAMSEEWTSRVQKELEIGW